MRLHLESAVVRLVFPCRGLLDLSDEGGRPVPSQLHHGRGLHVLPWLFLWGMLGPVLLQGANPDAGVHQLRVYGELQ